MSSSCKCLFALTLCALASPALGGLVVTSYRTVAQTNGFAPVSQAQYFAEQRLENVSPALAEVSGDWTGPNADGTPDTWHFVGSSRATSTTTITPDNYTVEAAASFAYVINTTSAFVDPRSTSIFGPGGAASYNGFFEADVPLSYTIAAQLNQRGRVRLSQIGVGGGEIFDENNVDVTPRLLHFSGTIQPGQYRFLATTGLGAMNLSNGINAYARSGSFESLVFSVRVPEPNMIGFGTVLVAMLIRRQRQASMILLRTGRFN